MKISEVPHLQLPPFAKQAFEVCGQVIRCTSEFQALRHPKRTVLRQSATVLFEHVQKLELEDDRYYSIVGESACLRKKLRQFSIEVKNCRQGFHFPHVLFDLQHETAEEVLGRYVALVRPGRKIVLLEESELQKQNCAYTGDFLNITILHSRYQPPRVISFSLLERFHWLRFAGCTHVSCIADLLSLEPERHFHETGTEEITLEICPHDGQDSMALLRKVLEGVKKTRRRLR